MLCADERSLTEEEIYTRAYEFIPERWYLYPDMIKEKSAWAPFSTGTSNFPFLLPYYLLSISFIRFHPLTTFPTQVPIAASVAPSL